MAFAFLFYLQYCKLFLCLSHHIFVSHCYFYNLRLLRQTSCAAFSLQTLAKFGAGKTGSGVGFLHLSAVLHPLLLRRMGLCVLVFFCSGGIPAILTIEVFAAPKDMFLSRFGPKTGIDSGYSFQENHDGGTICT